MVVTSLSHISTALEHARLGMVHVRLAVLDNGTIQTGYVQNARQIVYGDSCLSVSPCSLMYDFIVHQANSSAILLRAPGTQVDRSVTSNVGRPKAALGPTI